MRLSLKCAYGNNMYLRNKFTVKNKIYQCYFLSGELTGESKTLKEKVF